MKRPVISLRTYRQETTEHSHDDMWQLVLGGSGAMELTVGSDSGSVEQGRMAAIPPGITTVSAAPVITARYLNCLRTASSSLP